MEKNIPTVVCLLIGYPLAYLLARESGWLHRMANMLIMLPMWMNFLLRTYSWKFLLERHGLINTLLGMRIDVRCREAVIANTMGGFSGAAVFPVAVRMVYQVAKACSVPVMGCGGVTTARDVIEMMMAGATAVQVGAANLVNPYASKEIVEALPAEMQRLGIGRLSDIIGIVE